MKRRRRLTPLAARSAYPRLTTGDAPGKDLSEVAAAREADAAAVAEATFFALLSSSSWICLSVFLGPESPLPHAAGGGVVPLGVEVETIKPRPEAEEGRPQVMLLGTSSEGVASGEEVAARASARAVLRASARLASASWISRRDAEVAGFAVSSLTAHGAGLGGREAFSAGAAGLGGAASEMDPDRADAGFGGRLAGAGGSREAVEGVTAVAAVVAVEGVGGS